MSMSVCIDSLHRCLYLGGTVQRYGDFREYKIKLGGHRWISTCIHLYPPQKRFWGKFRLENRDFVGSVQSVNVVVVHVVVNSLPTAY